MCSGLLRRWRVFAGSFGLPAVGSDVDNDFSSDRRQEVKEYIERRYNINGKQRVFSAGTLTTLKVKAAIKDVARTMRIPVSLVNYITAIFDDDKCDFTGIFKLATQNKKIAKFVQDYPQLFEAIRTLMFQPRSSSIHASALLVTPNDMDGEDAECFDFTPIKKVDGMLVSEFSGYDLDECGLLKNDCLATKELSKLQQTLVLCNKEYGTNLTLESIATSQLDEPRAFELLANGHTQNVFQLSSRGMTKFIKELKPNHINDIIAANALFRPATLENGATTDFVDCKRGDRAPVYLWGTYEALKDTFGLITYQEQVVLIARQVGGFTLGEGVKLVKFISKKKTDKIQAMQAKFMAGAKKNGCPDEDAEAIWQQIEACGSYLFNKCISGREKLRRPSRPNGGLTIGDMYKTMHDAQWAKDNGHKHLHAKYNREGYGSAWSMVVPDDGFHKPFAIKHQIKDIRYMGIRTVYRITLENGATIDVTANHKHPTNHGEKRTDQLIVGLDKMYYCIGSVKEDTGYRFTDKDGAFNDEYYHTTGNETHYEINARKGHCGFHKRDTAYTRLEYYRTNMMANHCETCGESHSRLEIHHVNGDHSDCGDNFSNLITLCPSCHKKAHYKMGRKKMGEKGLDLELQTVVSVEYLRDEEVYDVEMEDPYHTFVTANNIMTCNSHATAYAVTSYVGAYLKAKYPTAFYTVALQWATDDELVPIMSEMELCSNAKVVAPDINHSGASFYTDFKTDEIFWSLTSIKMLGIKAVDWIIAEREKNGDFTSITNFIDRIFKYKLKKYEYWDDPDNEEEATRCPVNARHVRNLILAGCFDKVENALSVVERYAILEKAAEQLGFEIDEKDYPADLIGKHYFWSQQQIKVSGIGAVDYRRLFDNSELKPQVKGYPYMSFKEVADEDSDGRRCSIAATVVDCEEKKFKSSKTGHTETFCKITLQQNNDICECVVWPEEYDKFRPQIQSSKNKLIIFSAGVKYSDYSGKNNLQFTRNSKLEVL